MRQLATIVLAASILVGCASTYDEPYYPVPLQEMVEDQRVSVYGEPSLLREDGFILKVDGQMLYVSRIDTTTYAGRYDLFQEAVRSDIESGEPVMVKIYGVYSGDDTIVASFVEYEEALYSINK